MSDDDVTTLKARANALCDLGREREAVPLLLQALTLDPEDAHLLAMLASVHYVLDDNESTLRYADRVIAADPEWDRGYYWRCWALWALNRLEEALEAAEEATDIEPEDRDNLNILAWMQQKCGETAEAERTAQQLLTLAPDWSIAHFRMAWIYSQQERWHLAEAYYRKSLEIDPLDPLAMNNLALICDRFGRKQEAADLYYRALTVDPTAQSARSNLQARLNAEGFASMEEYLRGRENPDLAAYVKRRAALLKRCRALLDRNQWLQALLTLKSELKSGPPAYKDDPLLLDLLAEACVAGLQLSQALKYAEATVQAAPADVTGHRRRVFVLMKMAARVTGEKQQRLYKDALLAAEEALALTANQAEILTLLTFVQRQCGLLQEAEQTARRVIDLLPETAYAYMNLAFVYQQRELWRLAELYCRKALDYEPDNASFLTELGAILMQQQRFDEAIQCFERALHRDPKHRYAIAGLKCARAKGKGWRHWLAIGQLLMTELKDLD